jgi:hypothetical protein
MGVKASGLGEGPNIELIGIFQGDFGFVGDRFGHGWVSFIVRLTTSQNRGGFL